MSAQGFLHSCQDVGSLTLLSLPKGLLKKASSNHHDSYYSDTTQNDSTSIIPTTDIQLSTSGPRSLCILCISTSPEVDTNTMLQGSQGDAQDPTGWRARAWQLDYQSSSLPRKPAWRLAQLRAPMPSPVLGPPCPGAQSMATGMKTATNLITMCLRLCFEH